MPVRASSNLYWMLFGSNWLDFLKWMMYNGFGSGGARLPLASFVL